MKLIIAEKSSVGENIAKVIGATTRQNGYIEGNGYIVTWCIGHLMGLAMPDSYGEEYENFWTFENLPIIPTEWKFMLNPKKSHQFYVVKELVNRSDVDSLICATDAGREGECIFRYVYNYLNCKKKVERLWISSMEDKAISDGMANLQPYSNYDNLFAAGFSRAKADWLVGMNGSRVFSNRYGTNLNIGRVQTPILAMIVKRDYEIANFVKQKYYTVVLDCGEFTVSSDRIDDETTARELSDKCSGKKAAVTSVKKESKTVNPPKLYDLTTLQREANRLFGYTAKQTLDYIQTLYEGKLVTYPRTDSQYITDDMKQTALLMVDVVSNVFPDFVNGMVFGSELTSGVKRCINNAKVSDHHAIIPTREIENIDINSLPVGEKNILKLISSKLLIAVSELHKYEAVKVEVTCEGAADRVFTASGKTVLQNGFKELETNIKSVLIGSKTKSQDNSETKLPEISEGQEFTSVKSSVSEHFTTPPKPYTEDTLLKAMETAGNNDYDDDSDIEKKGLGTPATRSDIIENLIKRESITRDNKNLVSTEKGAKLIEVVPDEIKSAKLTADWETMVQHIEQGKLSAESFMENIENFICEMIKKYSSKADGVFASGKESLGKCPRCGKNIVEGKLNFYCESGKDGCGFSIWKDNKYPQTTMTADIVKKFLTEGKAELSTVDKSGKPYKAIFEMVDTGVYINFNDCKSDREVIGICPKCGKNVYENSKGYSCEDRNCGFVVWKTVSNKSISVSQAKKIIAKGKSDLIKGFTAKSGNLFDAYIVLKADKTTGFEFPPRKEK